MNRPLHRNLDRLLAEATEGLSTRDARLVQDRLLAVAGSSPWDGLSPRSWRDRTARTVTRVDADAAARRRKQRRAARSVRSAPTGDGMGGCQIFCVRGRSV
jgi:hypothetical protein